MGLKLGLGSSMDSGDGASNPESLDAPVRPGSKSRVWKSQAEFSDWASDLADDYGVEDENSKQYQKWYDTVNLSGQDGGLTEDQISEEIQSILQERAQRKRRYARNE